MHAVHKISIQSSQNTSANHSKKSSISKQKQPQQISFLNYIMLKEKPILTQAKPEEDDTETDLHIQRSMFNFLYVIGIGGFGKVWKVEHKKS